MNPQGRRKSAAATLKPLAGGWSEQELRNHGSHVKEFKSQKVFILGEVRIPENLILKGVFRYSPLWSGTFLSSVAKKPFFFAEDATAVGLAVEAQGFGLFYPLGPAGPEILVIKGT